MDFKTIYASGVQGKAGLEPDKLEENLFPFLDMVIEQIPNPTVGLQEKDFEYQVKRDLMEENFKLVKQLIVSEYL